MNYKDKLEKVEKVVKGNNEDYKSENRYYCKLRFGSRWLEDIDDILCSEKDEFDVWWEDWKKECYEDDCEYLIDEFGRYEINRVRNIVVMNMSDDSEEWYVEYNDGNKKLIECIKGGYNRGKMKCKGEDMFLEECLEIYLDDFSEKVL